MKIIYSSDLTTNDSGDLHKPDKDKSPNSFNVGRDVNSFGENVNSDSNDDGSDIDLVKNPTNK